MDFCMKKLFIILLFIFTYSDLRSLELTISCIWNEKIFFDKNKKKTKDEKILEKEFFYINTDFEFFGDPRSYGSLSDTNNEFNRYDRFEFTQDTFLKLYTHKNSYKEVAKFSTWIYTIAGNFAKTELRKFKRRKTYSNSDLSFDDREFIVEDRSKTASEILNQDQINKELNECLYELPLKFKTIIILRDIQELSYDEISTIVDLPLGTVKSRINRGRVKLHDCLQQKEDFNL